MTRPDHEARARAWLAKHFGDPTGQAARRDRIATALAAEFARVAAEAAAAEREACAMECDAVLDEGIILRNGRPAHGDPVRVCADRIRARKDGA